MARDPNELHVVDERLGLEPGTIYNVIFEHNKEPDDDVRDRLRPFGIELDPKWNSVRKDCRPMAGFDARTRSRQRMVA